VIFHWLFKSRLTLCQLVAYAVCWSDPHAAWRHHPCPANSDIAVR